MISARMRERTELSRLMRSQTFREKIISLEKEFNTSSEQNESPLSGLELTLQEKLSILAKGLKPTT